MNIWVLRHSARCTPFQFYTARYKLSNVVISHMYIYMVSVDLFNAFIFFLFIVSCILPNFISLYGLFVFPHVLLHFVHQIYVVAPYALLLNWKNASMHWKKSINIRTNIYWGTNSGMYSDFSLSFCLFFTLIRFLSFTLNLWNLSINHATEVKMTITFVLESIQWQVTILQNNVKVFIRLSTSGLCKLYIVMFYFTFHTVYSITLFVYFCVYSKLYTFFD